jgi:ribosome maturation factor RimP
MGARRPFFVKERTLADMHVKERQLEREISRRVEDALPGIEVLAVELEGPTRFCVFVDHPRGVDHALCERVTNVLRDYVREYSVEVSSPGLERPLRKPAHFERALGRKVALRTAAEIGGRKRFRGELVRASGNAVTVGLGGDEVDIPYDAIVRGNLIDEG